MTVNDCSSNLRYLKITLGFWRNAESDSTGQERSSRFHNPGRVPEQGYLGAAAHRIDISVVSFPSPDADTKLKGAFKSELN